MIKKLLNIALVAAMGVAFASCSEKTATGDATVGFETETIEVAAKEFINIPIYVTGTTSIYPVSVDVQIEAVNGENDVDFMMTSGHINIPAPTEDQIANNQPSYANVEVRIPDRKKEVSFKLTITSYKNAQNLGIASTTVTVKPSETIAVDALYGTWKATGKDLFKNGASTNWEFSIAAHADGGNKVVFDNLLNAKEGAAFIGEYSEDDSVLYIPLGQVHPSLGYDPNEPGQDGKPIGGDGKMYLFGLEGNNLYNSGNLSVAVEEDGTKLNFGKMGIFFALGTTGYGASGYNEVTATK